MRPPIPLPRLRSTIPRLPRTKRLPRRYCRHDMRTATGDRPTKPRPRTGRRRSTPWHWDPPPSASAIDLHPSSNSSRLARLEARLRQRLEVGLRHAPDNPRVVRLASGTQALRERLVPPHPVRHPRPPRVAPRRHMPDCEATVRLAQSPDVDPVSEDVRSGIGLPRAGGGGLARDDACLDPQQSGRREAHAPRPPTPPDIRVSYPAVLLGVVALDTSAPGLDSPPTPTALATPLWAQIGFRPLRLPRGAPRQPELVRHAFPAAPHPSSHPGLLPTPRSSALPTGTSWPGTMASADSSVPIQRHC